MKISVLSILKIMLTQPKKYLGLWLSGFFCGVIFQMRWIRVFYNCNFWEYTGPACKYNYLRIIVGGPVFIIIYSLAFISIAYYLVNYKNNDKLELDQILNNLNRAFSLLLLIVLSPLFNYSTWYFLFLFAVAWIKCFEYLRVIFPNRHYYKKHLLLIVSIIIISENVSEISNLNFITSIRTTLNKDVLYITKSGAGLEVLPKAVQTAIEGLRINDIKEYSCIGRCEYDNTINPYIIEGAWPIRNVKNSDTIVGFIEDMDMNKHELIWSKKGVGLAINKN